jgi:hypothetical protein
MNSTADNDNGLWTETRIRGLGAVTDLPTAGRIFGLGRSLAYELAKNDQFPAPVLRVGSRYRVPVAGILTALGIPGDLTQAAKRSVDHLDAIRSTGAHDDVYRGEP